FIASKGSVRQQAHQDVRIAPRRGGGEDTHGTAGVILLLRMRRRRKRARTQRNREVQNATPHTALTSRLGLAPDIVGQTSRSLASCASGVTGVHAGEAALRTYCHVVLDIHGGGTSVRALGQQRRRVF